MSAVPARAAPASALPAHADGAKGARERILAAAMDLAGREGLDALTTRKVAKEAGVNVGLLHYYFQSKEALVDETLGLFVSEMLATTGELAEVGTEAAARTHPEAATQASPEDLLSELFSRALVLAWERPGIIFGLIGRLVAAVAKSAQEHPAPGAELPGATLSPLDAMANMQAALFERIRPLLVARLEENPALVGRRAIQLFTSIFHPALFTPFPGLIFGLDLQDAERRREYVRAVVKDALEPPRAG